MMEKNLLQLLSDPGRVSPEWHATLIRISKQAALMGMPCFLVGGAVRDLLLERPVKDMDVVVEGDAIQFGRVLQAEFGGHLTIHQPFGTSIWEVSGLGPIDLITARVEIYSAPGSLPTIRPSTIHDDLHRRDFTINAMAIRLDGEQSGDLLDPLDGAKDLQAGVIRALHFRSFIDDPTRVFRAVRYERRYGFRMNPETIELVNPEFMMVLQNVSGERIRHEFDLIFMEDNCPDMLRRLEELDVLKVFGSKLVGLDPRHVDMAYGHSMLQFEEDVDRRTLGWILWLMNLPPRIIQAVSNRLDFPSQLRDSIAAASKLVSDLDGLASASPSKWVLRLDGIPLVAIQAVLMVSKSGPLKEYLAHWRKVKTTITGEHLKEMGLSPGPRFGVILFRLRAAWLDGEIRSEDEERALLDQLIQQAP